MSSGQRRTPSQPKGQGQKFSVPQINMSRNYGGQTAFAGRRPNQPGARGPSSPMIGPERATIVGGSNFTARRPAGGYGGNRSGGRGPPPEVARILNNFKQRPQPFTSSYGGASAGQSNSWKECQRKYIPGSGLPIEQPRQQQQFAQQQAPPSRGGLPSGSRQYVPFGGQPQPEQQAPPMPSRAAGGRRPTVDLSKFQRDYKPPRTTQAPPTLRAPPVQDPSDFAEEEPHYEEQMDMGPPEEAY